MIVVVDDDEDFRLGVAENLRDDGHTVVEYDGPRALPPLETLVVASVLLTDYQMVGENGLALAIRFHASHPRVPVVLVTACWTDHLQGESSKHDFLHLLRKPLDYSALHETLHRLTVTSPER